MSRTTCADNPYLAVIDDSLEQSATYLDNTIGGPFRLPRCLISGFDPGLVICGQCGRPMLNLVQLSCPLIGLDCRRFLYFFLCQNFSCLEGPTVPIVCLRAQFPCAGGCESTAAGDAKRGDKVTRSYSEWGEGADDWGDDETSNMEAEALPVHVESEVLTRAAEGEVDNLVAETFVVQDVKGILPCRQLCVFDEAEVVSPVTVDHQLATLIHSAEEQLRSTGEYLGESSGYNGVTDKAPEVDDECNQALTKLEQKFYERLALCPGQLLRYQWAGRPLLVAPLLVPPAPVCQVCGGERIFELQLMPGLLEALRGVSEISDKLDMATALVFTCAASCQPPANGPLFVKEIVIAQRELPLPRAPHSQTRPLADKLLK